MLKLHKRFIQVLLLTSCYLLSSHVVAQNINFKVDQVFVNSSTGSSGGWVEVSFPSEFGSVPVVIVTPTNTNPDPATVRIRNVTTRGFEALVVEPSGSDGETSAMTIDYFAAEERVYTFPGGVRMEVGSISTTTQQGRSAGAVGWENISFSSNFSSPAVVTQIQTTNSQPALDAGIVAIPWLEVTLSNVSGSNMDIALERSETSDGTLVSETIGYIVMDSGDEINIAGETISALQTATNIQGWSDGCFTNSFTSSFTSAPLVVASQNTRNGPDGGWIRRCSLSSTAVGLTVDEDVNVDSERGHYAEIAGVFAVSGEFMGARNGRDIAAGQFTVAAGASTADWTSVEFSTPFDVTPHVFALNGNLELAPSELRVRNVSNSGFDIALFKPTGESGAAAGTLVDYVAAAPGRYAMENGDLFEIGSISTTEVQGLVGATGWETLSFETEFSSPPALITQIQTIANEPSIDPSAISVPWLTVATRNLGADSVQLALETAQTRTGSVSTAETIAYFAAENGSLGQLGSGGSDSITYEMFLSQDFVEGWDNGCYVSSFSRSYTSPLVIASQVRRDGSDGGWVRRCSLTSNSVGVTIDEDQDLDIEREHTTEQVGIFVFGGPFEGDIALVDHYAISHGQSALTCEAERVTISAHNAFHAEIPANATIRISATSGTPGWLASDVRWSLASGGNALGTSGPGYVDYTFASGESEVQLWLFNPTEAVIDIDVVDVDNSALTDLDDGGSEDALLSFASTGFRFYADANGDGDADGTDPIASTMVAGNVSDPFILKAVETDTETGACEARLSGTHSVQLAYECVSPNTCVRENDALANGVSVAENDAGSISRYQTVGLEFDAEGEAPLTLQYFDAGQIRLHAQYTLSASAGDGEITLSGASSLTTSKPADLFVTSITAPGGAANPGSTGSGSGFVAAGSAFIVNVEARGATGIVTPNFTIGNSGSGEGIELIPESLVMPSGGDIGAFSNASQFTATATLGVFQNNSVTWDNVGTFTMRAEIEDGDYLGSGNVVGTTTGNVGRFYPAEFSIANGSVNNGCVSGGFTYMSDPSGSYRPISTNIAIQALTAGGVVASNYSAGYPITSLEFVLENGNDGIDRSGRVVSPALEWVDGVLSSLDSIAFTRLENAGSVQVDGPYTSLQFGLRPDPSAVDPTTFSDANLNLNPNTSNDCVAESDCDSAAIGSLINAVFGRLYAKSAHGPESAELPLDLQTQFWSGTRFERNSSDSCTAIAPEHTSFDGSTLATNPGRSVAIGSSSTTGNFDLFSIVSGFTVLSGDAGLVFSAPGAGNTGSFLVEVDLSNYPWLRYDWNQDGDSDDDTALPGFEVSFGSYRGHDRIIYWREVLTN